MDRLEKTSNIEKDGFIKEVFPFDQEQKTTLLNIIQFTVLAIIPVVILLKLIKNYIPEADEDKGSLVILLEVVGQLVAMFVSLYFINRIINYFPTYSGKAYGDVNIISIIPAIILIAVTMQTKLGEKIQILVDRLWELYDGKPQKQNGNNNQQTTVKVSQPLSQNLVVNQPTQQVQMPINNTQERMQSQMTNMKSQTNEYSIQQSPDFNNMFQGPNTPLVDAANPTQNEYMTNNEPMAANDAFGSSFGSSF
jgi:hypothetical protein